MATSFHKSPDSVSADAFDIKQVVEHLVHVCGAAGSFFSLPNGHDVLISGWKARAGAKEALARLRYGGDACESPADVKAIMWKTAAACP